MIKIILLDSDPRFTTELKNSLGAAGHQVEAANTLDVALRLYRKEGAAISAIAVVREWPAGKEHGLGFLLQIKQEMMSAPVPLILISSEWQKPDFARHQSSPGGVQGYFNRAQPLQEFLSLLEMLTGQATSIALNGTKSLDVRLYSAESVLNLAEDIPENIFLEEPVSLLELTKEIQATHFAPPEEPVPLDLPVQLVSDMSVALSEPAVSSESLVPPLPPLASVPLVPPLALDLPDEGAVAEAPFSSPPTEMSPPLDVNVPPSSPPAFMELKPASLAPDLVETIEPIPTTPVQQGFDFQSSDLETLKRYLSMREQDIAVLTAQVSYAKEEIQRSESMIQRLKLDCDGYEQKISLLNAKLEDQEKELSFADKRKQDAVEGLALQLRTKTERVELLEEKLKNAQLEQDSLKERVRHDIRKIRARERELENKLEILKKDSETLIASRENKILELKRKIDLLEFNYDSLAEKNEREKAKIEHYHARLEQIQKALREAVGVVESEENVAIRIP